MLTDITFDVVTIPRSNFVRYRIPERERSCTPTLLAPGTKVHFKRSLVRCGYRFEPTDMPPDLLLSRLKLQVDACSGEWARLHLGRAMTEEETRLAKGITERVLQLLVVADKPYTRIDRVSLWAQPGIRSVTKVLAYRLRQEWVNEQHAAYRKEHPELASDLNLRTFWYQDHNPITGTVTGDVMRMIGHAEPGHTHHDYEGGWEYEPPTFGTLCRQRLLRVRPDTGQNVDYHPVDDRKRIPIWEVLVHPLDLEVMDE